MSSRVNLRTRSSISLGFKKRPSRFSSSAMMQAIAGSAESSPDSGSRIVYFWLGFFSSPFAAGFVLEVGR